MRPPSLPGSLEGYRALAALTPDPVAVVDAALRIVVVNRPFQALFDADSADQMTGGSILERLVEWERVRAANLVARFLEIGIWDIAELTALRDDGTTFPIEARCEMLQSATGAFAGMLVLIRNLSDRHTAEDPLRSIVAGTAGAIGEDFFPSLVRHLAQIFSVRFAVVAELVEPERTQARTLAFWSGEGIAGNLTYDLAGTPCARVARGDTCYYPEGIQQLFPDDPWLREVGAEGYIGTPLRDSTGRIIGLVEVLDAAPIYRSRDVGSIMQIFAARAAAELERVRIERELHRNRELLLQSQKLEGIGRLAGGVAHDFNNLLTAMLGFSESALETLPDDAPARADLLQIRRAALSASGLTAQLLTFARRQAVAPRVLDLGELLQELRPLLTQLLGEGIALEYRIPAALWPIEADPGQLEQVLVNLTRNAREAMPRGGTLQVTLDHLAGGTAAVPGHSPGAEGDWVRLTFADTGVGMSAETLALAFEPFFTTKDAGAGLGLATCHGIIRRVGGQIWAESDRDEGTRIVILLPRTRRVPAPAPSDAAAAPAPGTETILVVEDEPAVRRLAVRALTRLGYQVIAAADGEEGLAAAAALDGPLHLVVSDVLLPRLNGPEMVRTLLERTPETKVLFVSGFANDSLELGGHGELTHPFLPKPYLTTTLTAKVREILDRR